MELWLICLVLITVSLIEMPKIMINWHITPKIALVLITGLVSALMMIRPLSPLMLNLGWAQILALSWGVWCMASCIWSHEPRFSFRSAIFQLSLALLFILVSSSITRADLFIISLAGSLSLLPNVAFANYQHYYGDPWIPTKTGTKGGQSGCGFATHGNRCWYSAYVVGAITFPLYLTATNSPFWFLLVAWSLWTLKLARSKSSALALSFGLAGILALFLGWWKRFSTIRYRTKYIRAALWLIKERPIMGHGMRMFRREIYRANDAINKATKGDFLKLENYERPQPREVHSEPFGFMVETGLIGSLLLWSSVGIVIYHALMSQSVTSIILVYGLLAMTTNSLVFYVLRIPGSAIVFWLLMGMIEVNTGSGTLITYQIPLQVSLLLAIIISAIMLKLIIRYILFAYFLSETYKKGNAKLMEKAISYDKHNSMPLMSLVTACRRTDPIKAALLCQEMIEHFDGDTLPWAIWANYGNARLALGSVAEAKMAFQMGLKYLPYNTSCIKGIQMCDKIINSGGQVVIQYNKQGANQQNGLQNTPAQHSAVRPKLIPLSNKAKDKPKVSANTKAKRLGVSKRRRSNRNNKHSKHRN